MKLTCSFTRNIHSSQTTHTPLYNGVTKSTIHFRKGDRCFQFTVKLTNVKFSEVIKSRDNQTVRKDNSRRSELKTKICLLDDIYFSIFEKNIAEGLAQRPGYI